jgi:hypothetical protein
MTSRDSLKRINALAVAAAVLFAVAVATILVLDRIGVSDRLVRAIGPILTLLGVALFGLGARNADLASFLAARREAPPFYGALSFAAVVAGMTFCFYPDLASFADPAPLGVAAGAALGAIGFGPLLRKFGATSANDVVATRFLGSPAVLLAGITAWATAALTALAGFEMAVAATAALATTSRLWAEILVSTAIVLGAAPGGLAGVFWCAAACAGEIVMIGALGWASAWPHAAGWSGAPPLAPGSSASLVASALAVAGFFALQVPVFASQDVGSAIRAGVLGSALCVALAAMAISALALFPVHVGAPGPDAAADSLFGAVTLASTLALAGIGVHASSRAFGVALAAPSGPFPTPASVRLARMRIAQVALVVGCAICDARGFLDPRTALTLGIALSLAVTIPIIALAAIRMGAFSASAATLTGLAVGVRLAFEWPPNAAGLFEKALAAGAAAFAAGVLASRLAPRSAPAPTPGAFDPFGSGSGREQKQAARFVINAPVSRGQNPPALGRVVAVPGREDAAGSLDDRSKGDNVMRL